MGVEVHACYSDTELTHQNTCKEVWQFALGLLNWTVKDKSETDVAILQLYCKKVDLKIMQ